MEGRFGCQSGLWNKGAAFSSLKAETDYDANINSLIDGDGCLHRDDRRRGWGCGAGAAASGGWKTLR